MRLLRGAVTLLTVLLLALVILPTSGAAQISYGGHLVQAQDAFGGAGGVGARVGVGLPLFPVTGFVSAEYFFPDCGAASGCGLSGVSLDLNYTLLPLPVVTPYLTGGVVARRIDLGGASEARSETGLHAGAGVSAGVPGMRVFGEARYEFVQAPERQFVLRLGVLLGS